MNKKNIQEALNTSRQLLEAYSKLGRPKVMLKYARIAENLKVSPKEIELLIGEYLQEVLKDVTESLSKTLNVSEKTVSELLKRHKFSVDKVFESLTTDPQKPYDLEDLLSDEEEEEEEEKTDDTEDTEDSEEYDSEDTEEETDDTEDTEDSEETSDDSEDEEDDEEEKLDDELEESLKKLNKIFEYF